MKRLKRKRQMFRKPAETQTLVQKQGWELKRSHGIARGDGGERREEDEGCVGRVEQTLKGDAPNPRTYS
jgi:hypothetical protein